MRSPAPHRPATQNADIAFCFLMSPSSVSACLVCGIHRLSHSSAHPRPIAHHGRPTPQPACASAHLFTFRLQTPQGCSFHQARIQRHVHNASTSPLQHHHAKVLRQQIKFTKFTSSMCRSPPPAPPPPPQLHLGLLSWTTAHAFERFATPLLSQSPPPRPRYRRGNFFASASFASTAARLRIAPSTSTQRHLPARRPRQYLRRAPPNSLRRPGNHRNLDRVPLSENGLVTRFYLDTAYNLPHMRRALRLLHHEIGNPRA